MKSHRLIIILFLLISGLIQAQINEKGFSFQGYARDHEGTAMGNQDITVKFSIYPEGGSPAFVEEQAITTDPYGVFSATVGSVNQAGFYGLEWVNNEYWLKVEVRAFGGDFVTISDAKLLSVPYAQAAANGVPAGTIIPFAGPKANIPKGYVPCDGTAYSPTDARYVKLYEAIGTSWGQEGVNFRVPDLRGYFLRGLADGQGIDPDRGTRAAKYTGGATGDNVGSYQADELASHAHGHSLSTGSAGDHTHSGAFREVENTWSGGGSSSPGNGTGNGDNQTGTAGAHTHSINGTIHNTGGSETRPENAYVLYIIKL